MPSANDVYITPASRKIEWYGSSAMKGQIHHDDTNFYVSGTLDLKLQGGDDISLMGYSGGSIITFGTDQTERMRLTEAGNFGIGTPAPAQKLYVSGGATSLDNAGGVSLYLKNAGSTYLSFDSYGGPGVSIATPADMHVSGATGITFKTAANGIVLAPTGTSAGDTLPLRFRELAANGSATIRVRAPDSISNENTWVLPPDIGTANQVLTVASVASTEMTLDWADASGGGTIGGSITDNQVAFGASTSNSIEGSADLTYDGYKLTIGRTAGNEARGVRILDDEGTETISLITSSSDHGLLYLRGATGGNSIYLDANGASYINGGYIGFGTTSPDNQAEVTVVGKIYANIDANGNLAVGSGSFAHTSGIGNYSGYYSTGIGVETLKTISGAAHRNTAVGYRAMFGDSTGIEGTDNTAVGAYALQNIKDGTYNVAIGASSGLSMTDGTNNTFVGLNSGRLNTTGNQNTAMGQGAMYNNVHGDHNTALGYYALHSLAPADGAGQNTALGSYAGYKTSTGHTNVFVGYLAGYEHLTGERNVVVGNEAGRNLTTGHSNTFLGQAAGFTASGAIENVFVGRNAGYFITGGQNVFIGNTAGRSEAAATHATVGTVAIGKNAMYYNSTTNYCVAIGESALIGSSSDPWMTGDYNVAVGRQALADTTTGEGNVALGYLAGKGVTTGGSNIFIGLQAGQYNAGGAQNTIVGYLAGRNNTGNYNTILGYDAGITQTSSNRNTFLGYGAGKDYAQTGDNKNTAVGMYAMTDIQSGSNNTALGYQALAGVNGSDNDYNVAVGYQALFATNGGDNNTAIGYQALTASTTAHSNVAIGYQAGYNVTEAIRSQFIGGEAGGSVTTAQYNTIMGYQAGHSLTVTGNNVLIGKYAGRELSKDFSTMVGVNAGQNTSTGINNTYIGASAAKNSSTGYYNVAIGNNAGSYLSGATGIVDIGYGAGFYVSGNGNVFIGLQAGMGDATQTTNHANYNVGIGYESMKDITSGFYNIAMGMNSLANITGGDYNVALGNQAGEQITTQNENTLVGNYAGQDLTGQYNVFLGSSAGFNATSADNNVAIGRQAMGSAVLTGDSNVAIGYTAGHTATSALANVLVGQGAGYGITTAQKSVVIGNNAGYAMATQGGSVIIGFEAGRFQDAGSGGSVAIGHQALYSGTQNYQNVALGYNAGRKATGASASNVYLGTHAGPSSTGAESNKLYINNAEGTPLIGGDFSADEIYLNGNVGIGTTSPSDIFHVYGSATDSMQYKTDLGDGFDGIQLVGGNPALKLDGGGSTFVLGALSAGLAVFDQTNGAYRMIIQSDGKVGIGTFSPNSKMTVQGDLDIPVNSRFRAGSASSDTGVDIYHDGSNNYSLIENRPSGGDLIFRQMHNGKDYIFKADNDSGTEQEIMRIDGSNARVGIGTTAPGAQLDIHQTADDTALEIAGYDDKSGVTAKLHVRSNGISRFQGSTDAQVQSVAGSIYLASSEHIYLDVGTRNTYSHIFRDDTGEFARFKNARLGIGTTSPGAKLDIVSTSDNNTAGIRIGDGTNFCALYTDSNENFIIDPTNDFIVTGSDDIKLECNDDFQMIADDFYFLSGSQSILNIKYDAGGVTNYRGTVGKIWHEATPVAQIKDDTGFIMEDNQGIKNHVQSLSNFTIDAGTGINTVDIQGYSKIQNILLDPQFNPPGFLSATSLNVKLPVAVAGMEFIVTLGVTSLNLGNLTLKLIANGSDTIYNGANAVSFISYAKNVGESIHVICFEANKWSVVAHT
jgi:hypothetical protein